MSNNRSEAAGRAKKSVKKRAARSKINPKASLKAAGKTAKPGRWRLRLQATISHPKFGKAYASFGLLVLLLTTLFWGILGAKLQSHNADQLINSYLFQTGSTLHGAVFPAAHSQLLKWPLFLAFRVIGYSSAAYIGMTLLCTVVTVGFLAMLICRIERRPLVYGSLLLGLSSVLLMIPAQPYAGGLLPVNMAMLTTRNIEYVLFIGAVLLALRAGRLRSRSGLAAMLAFGLLFASDRLFLGISLAAATVAVILYAARRQWQLVTVAVRWLLCGLVGAVLAVIIAAVLAALQLAQLASGSGGAPYGLAKSLKDLAVGTIYALLGFLTNLGANPAYDATRISDIPHSAAHHLLSFGGSAHIVNAVLAVAIVVASFQLASSSWHGGKPWSSRSSVANRLALMLLLSSLVATGLFIITEHQYAVDARYLALWTFAGFIVLAAASRQRKWRSETLLLAAGICLLATISGGYYALQTYRGQTAAFSAVHTRNQRVNQIVADHHVKVLVGDYWRVLPAKLQANTASPIVLPLSGCLQPKASLTSSAWQPDLRKNSFAYLLSLDKSLTDYPSCSINQVTAAYGTPNSSELIAGSLAKPKELLLFYDTGSRPANATSTSKTPVTTVLPTPLSDLQHTNCQVPTVMNVIAHQDDDLLFMNPDLLHDLSAGRCVRTVYLTAGDAGTSQSYWIARQQGSQAAYAEMLGIPNIWEQRIVRLPGGQFVRIASPKADQRISLIYMHLPDGNLGGEGFSSSHEESLARLEDGRLTQLQTVDGQSQYTQKQLSAALTTLMHTYQPSEIHTQSQEPGQGAIHDHSDHNATGRITVKAYKQYEFEQYDDAITIPITFYSGYPGREQSPNVNDGDLAAKEAAFLAYAAYDAGVCHSIAECAATPTYGSYLTRQYTQRY